MNLSHSSLYLPVLFAAFLLSYAHAKPLSHDSAYVLKSSSKRFGNQTLTLSSKGLRLDQPMFGLVYVAKPPDWRIFAFSPAERMVCDCGTGGKNCSFPIIPPGKREQSKSLKNGSLHGLAVTIASRAASPEEFYSSGTYRGGW